MCGALYDTTCSRPPAVGGGVQQGLSANDLPQTFAWLTLLRGMPCTQCEVLNVGQYSDPTFGLF